MNTIALLDREIYSFREVDQLVGLKRGTARRWINGYQRAGKQYAPILRDEGMESDWVTWGEFVETRILAEFRDRDSVSTSRLRAAVAALRERYSLKYPLATLRPYLSVEAGELAVDGLTEQHDSRSIVRTGQLILLDGLEVINHAALSEDVGGERFAAQLGDAAYPGIVLNPNVFGGQPTFEGRRVAVATIAEIVAAGAAVADVAADYELSIAQVEMAAEYAASHRVDVA